MEGQNAMTRAIVGVELLCMDKLVEFKDTGMPTVSQVCVIVGFSLHYQLSIFGLNNMVLILFFEIIVQQQL